MIGAGATTDITHESTTASSVMERDHVEVGNQRWCLQRRIIDSNFRFSRVDSNHVQMNRRHKAIALVDITL